MRHIAKKVIAVAFALPEVGAVLSPFLTAGRVKVFQEFQDNHFAHFKLSTLSGQENAVARNEAKQALSVFR